MEFPISEFVAWFESNEEKIQEDFFRFLRFRSISTEAVSKEECLKTADFLSSFLSKIGMKVDLLKSSGLPVVFAESQNTKENTPSVLLYHHYDVQPIDPIELWQTDPFDPKIRDGKVFARGASDNKGQCFITLTALSAFHALIKELPLHIKLFIEGEEEAGGIGANGKEAPQFGQCAAAVLGRTGQVRKRTPASVRHIYGEIPYVGLPRKRAGAVP